MLSSLFSWSYLSPQSRQFAIGTHRLRDLHTRLNTPPLGNNGGIWRFWKFVISSPLRLQYTRIPSKCQRSNQREACEQHARKDESIKVPLLFLRYILRNTCLWWDIFQQRESIMEFKDGWNNRVLVVDDQEEIHQDFEEMLSPTKPHIYQIYLRNLSRMQKEALSWALRRQR